MVMLYIGKLAECYHLTVDGFDALQAVITLTLTANVAGLNMRSADIFTHEGYSKGFESVCQEKSCKKLLTPLTVS